MISIKKVLDKCWQVVAGGGKCWQMLGGLAECAGLLDFVRSCQNLKDFDIRFHHALLPFGGGGFKRSAHSAGPRVEGASARDVARSTTGGERTQPEGHASTSREK